MSEAKKALERTAFYCLLLAINIIPCASVIPDVFPMRNLSTVYLLALSVCLVLYYAHRVSPAGQLSRMMKALSWMGLLLILLRGIKYSAVAEVGALARHAWYLYYVPLLLLPLFYFYISLLVAPKSRARVAVIRRLTLILTAFMIAAVLTNDLHCLIFRFHEGFENWDAEYTRGWLFYVVTVWQYALYLAATAILIFKCRIVSSKKSAWVILIPALIGFALLVLILTGSIPKLNGAPIMEFPEALIFTAATVLECCMQLGLIPTNTDYGKLFRHFSISAQITDRKGTVVYSSPSAAPLTKEQIASDSPARIGAHILLHRMTVPGGYGFWQDDMSGIDRLNDELRSAKEKLAEEGELIRLRSELIEKRAKIEQRSNMLDAIARRTARQSQLISRLAGSARASSDAGYKDACRRRITLLGAYVKRYANLTLLSEERGEIEAGELGLSVSEVLRYLNYRGIPGEYIGAAEGLLPACAVLAVFEAFETLLEENDACISGVSVNFSSGEERAVFKVTFENLAVTLPPETSERLSAAGVCCEHKKEDNVSYFCFTLPKGGETK